MIIFIATVITISGLIHWFLYSRLVSALEITSAGLLWTLRGTAAFLSVSYILVRILEHKYPGAITHALDWLASVWIGIWWQLLWVTALVFFVKVGLVLSGQWGNFSLETQTMLGRAGFYFVTVVVSSLSVWGVATAYGRARIVEVGVPVENYRSEYADLKIAMVADFHASNVLGEKSIGRLCRQIMDRKPDLILIPGDIVDTPAEQITSVARAFQELRAPLGVYGSTGNHEYYVGFVGAVNLIREGGIVLLLNQSVRLPNGITITGVEDRTAKQMRRAVPAPETLLAESDSGNVKILLMHTPATGDVTHAMESGYDLVVSGHTHGGQIWPFTFFTKLAFPYHHGLYAVGKGFQLTTCGIGFWGPPMRVGKPPEIMMVRLLPAGSEGTSSWN